MINLIAAVGQHGEIGYQGRIPWLNDPTIANVTKDDLGWFARQTAGGVLVVGALAAFVLIVGIAIGALLFERRGTRLMEFAEAT